MADDDYKHGEMDITAQEKTFDGFMRYVVNIGIVCIVIIIFLAIFASEGRTDACPDPRPPSARRALALALLLGLAACAAEPVWAPDEVVSQARYVPSGPAKIQLLTMISNRNGSGGHSAL
jgi:hypothetical protein